METNEKTYDKYLLSHTYYMQIWYILCPTSNSLNTIKKISKYKTESMHIHTHQSPLYIFTCRVSPEEVG